VAGETAGTDLETASEPDPGNIQQMGLRQQALEVEGMLCRAAAVLTACHFSH